MPRKRSQNSEPSDHVDHGHHDEEAVYSQGGADDALGLYLKQMGAIPLLSREKELALAIRLEIARKRYRHAVLFSWWSIRRIADVFAHVQAGEFPIDPQIDTVQSAGLSRETIVGRMPANLKTLKRLMQRAARDFAIYQRTRTASGRARVRRDRWRQLRKAVRLLEELSPRTELLDALADEMARTALSMSSWIGWPTKPPGRRRSANSAIAR
jgi:RNA polymerase primary sigma factor